MDRYQHHFLDSCIIIGLLLDFDLQYKKVVEYFNKDFRRHTSKRVQRYEVRGRLEGIRRELMSFSEWLESNIDKFSGIPINGDVISFLNHYKPYDEEHNKGMLQRVYQKYLPSIKDYILNHNLTVLDNLRSDIVGAISKAQNRLSKLCYYDEDAPIKVHKTPNRYDNIFRKEFVAVKNSIRYEKDALVLLDAYFVKHEIKEDLGFITTDEKHILPNAAKIEKLLKGIFIFGIK